METTKTKNPAETSILSFIHSSSQLLGWSAILFLLAYYAVHDFNEDTLHRILLFLRIFQSLQVVDIVLGVLKITKTNILASFMQILGRLYVTFFYINDQVQPNLILQTLACWSFAEVVRNLYYLSKNSYVVKTLRYNAFIVLYPAGIMGEILTIEQYLNSDANNYYLHRIIQITIFSGFLYLYKYLLDQRREYYRKKELEDINIKSQ